MDNDAKIRPLYIAKILYEMTDECNRLRTSDIIKILKDKYNINGHRITIASDIELLKEFGMDIEVEKLHSNEYYLASREFDLPEVKLLIDSVASSKFITDRKSNDLISKLGKLVSSVQSSSLKRNVVPEGRIKADNENIYYIVDTINTAINLGKKISFQYFSYNPLRQRITKHGGMEYTFSPYYLVWNGDYYYVVGYSQKHKDIGCFRVDRIVKAPKILRDNATPMPEDFNLNQYINTNFRMYSSEHQQVELLCDNSVIDSIIDKFGDNLEIRINNSDTFVATVEVAVNHIFLSWIFGFGGKVKIKSPDSVSDKYKDMIRKACENL